MVILSLGYEIFMAILSSIMRLLRFMTSVEIAGDCLWPGEQYSQTKSCAGDQKTSRKYLFLHKQIAPEFLWLKLAGEAQGTRGSRFSV